MKGSLRSPLKIRKRILITTNPYGVNHNNLKKRFYNPSPVGKPIVTKYGKTLVSVYSSFVENPYILKDTQYIQNLMADPNKIRRRAWLMGDMDISSGGIVDDLWNADFHVLSSKVKIPSKWNVRVVMDWGHSKPFAVLWVVENTTGESLGSHFSMKGDKFIIKEYYGSLGNNEGMKLNPSAVQKRILEINKELGLDSKTLEYISDSQIFQDHGVPSISTYFDKINWKPATKGKDSRVNGLSVLREYLSGSVPVKGYREKKGLFVFDNCRDFISLVPIIPCDKNKPDDADTESEDHLYDAIRYELQTKKSLIGSF